MKREIESVFFRCDRLFDGIATSEKNCVHVCAHTETVHEITGPLNVLCAIHRAHQAEWFDFIEASIFIPYEQKQNYGDVFECFDPWEHVIIDERVILAIWNEWKRAQMKTHLGIDLMINDWIIGIY